MKTVAASLRIFWRLVGFPFFLGIIVTATIRDVLWLSWKWLRWGGEMIAHREHSKGIMDVYLKLEKHIDDFRAPTSEGSTTLAPTNTEGNG